MFMRKDKERAVSIPSNSSSRTIRVMEYGVKDNCFRISVEPVEPEWFQLDGEMKTMDIAYSRIAYLKKANPGTRYCVKLVMTSDFYEEM